MSDKKHSHISKPQVKTYYQNIQNTLNPSRKGKPLYHSLSHKLPFQSNQENNSSPFKFTPFALLFSVFYDFFTLNQITTQIQKFALIGCPQSTDLTKPICKRFQPLVLFPIWVFFFFLLLSWIGLMNIFFKFRQRSKDEACRVSPP